jgi:hypothetical protein
MSINVTIAERGNLYFPSLTKVSIVRILFITTGLQKVAIITGSAAAAPSEPSTFVT